MPKFIAVFATLFACCLLFSSCTNVANDQPTEEDRVSVQEISAVKTPPELIVHSRFSSVEVSAAGYSWNYNSDNGERVSAIADRVHPLDNSCKPVQYKITPTYHSSVDPTVANLSFDTAPDSVNVVAWSVEERGNISAESSDVGVLSNEDGLYINLFGGSYIYEVTAQWNDNGAFFGRAHYVFDTLFDFPEIPDTTDEINICGYPLKPET